MNGLFQQFQANWQTLFPGVSGRILLAVSGGMDSMVMASLFLQSGIPLAVGHCHFGLRGTDADADAALVESWAAQHEIPFHATRFDTKKISANWKKGIQETARILRYEWLEKIRKQYGYTKITTAHHAQDNAETLLINLLKGTGISGLHGIPEKNGTIIRPLLFATKAAITAYAQERQIPFREDASNADDKYLRNAVRHHILPVIAQYFPGATDRLNESIFRFRQAEILYKKAVEDALNKLVEQRGRDYYVPVKKLLKAPAPETLCYEWLRPYGFRSAQMPVVKELLHAGSGRILSSETHRLIRDRDFLILTTATTASTDIVAIAEAPFRIAVTGKTFTGRIHTDWDLKDACTTVAFMDADKISFPLLLRRWRTGDYFYPLGMEMKKKKLSRFFIDRKLPVHEKEQVWVLESRKRILWVAGMRTDERFKVTNTTRSVLKIELGLE